MIGTEKEPLRAASGGRNRRSFSVRQHPFLGACAGDKVYLLFVYMVCALSFVITLYPFIYILAVSFSGSTAVYKGKVFLLPVDPTVEGYIQVLKQKGFWQAYGNTILYTVVGTALNIAATTIAAYPLSRQRFFARRFFNFFIAFTMYFSGGMIPKYIVNTSIGLYNSRWVMWIPALLSTYNVMICRSAFSAIPDELTESAEIDGANDIMVFFHLAIRLIPATLSVLTLYYAVGHWNSFFTPLVYFSKEELMPVQVILRRVLIQSSSDFMESAGNSGKAAFSVQIRYVTIVVATLPILCVYPLIQKYFVKGVMIGAVKG